VRSLRCYEVGLSLRGITLAPTPHVLHHDPARAVLVEFLAAAVCHATNWDRLRNHLLNAAVDSDRFVPVRLAGLAAKEFTNEFSGAFRGARDLPRRYEMFTEVAGAFARGEDPFDGKRLIAEPRRLAGPRGLYTALDRLDAFRADPQRKKARILVQQLDRTGLLTIADPENLRPAIEYHLVRLYLCTGRVVHADALDLRSGSARASDVRSINALRAAVEQAMHYTADGAELPLPIVNEIEWQMARSYCERSAPRCGGPPRADKPVDPAVAAVAEGTCPFASTCDAPRTEALARLNEPRLAERHAFY